jgi:hypothetical protein
MCLPDCRKLALHVAGSQASGAPLAPGRLTMPPAVPKLSYMIHHLWLSAE